MNKLNLTIGDKYFTFLNGEKKLAEAYTVTGYIQGNWYLTHFNGNNSNIICIEKTFEDSFNDQWFKTKEEVKTYFSKLKEKEEQAQRDYEDNPYLEDTPDCFGIDYDSSLNHPSTANFEMAQNKLKSGVYIRVARLERSERDSWFITKSNEDSEWFGGFDYVLIMKKDYDVLNLLLKNKINQNIDTLIEDDEGNQYHTVNNFIETYVENRNYFLA